MQYRFTKANADAIGVDPVGTLTPAGGSSSVLYGTTESGGTGDNSSPCLFTFTPGATEGSGILKVIHSFTGMPDGAEPLEGRVSIDSSGNIIGVTNAGGTYGAGTIFTCAPDGSGYQILHEFGDSSDNDYGGDNPIDGLTLGSDGAYYGVTSFGGEGYDQGGVVYRFDATDPAGGFSVLYNFNSTGDGYIPVSKPFEDSDGNLVGTTLYTFNDDNGDERGGVLYKLAAGLPNPVNVKSVSLSLATVVGGEMNSTATVTINKPAGSKGAVLSLDSAVLNRGSGTPGAVSIPSSVTVPAGGETATFTVTTHAVNATTDEQITAAYNNSQSNDILGYQNRLR